VRERRIEGLPRKQHHFVVRQCSGHSCRRARSVKKMKQIDEYLPHCCGAAQEAE
jgi:hypothetical protein